MWETVGSNPVQCQVVGPVVWKIQAAGPKMYRNRIHQCGGCEGMGVWSSIWEDIVSCKKSICHHLRVATQEKNGLPLASI